MEEKKDGRRPIIPCGIAQWLWPLVVISLGVHTVAAAAERRHFQLDAGEAPVMLNEFSRQSDLQVLFDFNVLKGLKTHAVTGDLDPSTALDEMLEGTNLTYDFVNERTLAVTLRRSSLLSRFWQRVKPRAKRVRVKRDGDDLEQVLVSGTPEGSTQPLLGAQTIELTRVDIDRSGFATTQDFLRTLPQVFGGGPNLTTTVGREAQTNSNIGAGVNIRGLDAGATLVLIDGKRIAPSGTEGAFDDVSNIPLSIVDHIDVLPDAVGARYGADAVGGVVNFITRKNFSGATTQLRNGGVTNGHMGERQFSQFLGRTRDSGNDFVSFEYFHRDALQAEDRWQQTSDLTRYGGSNFDFQFGSPGSITTDLVHYWPLPKGQNGTSLSAANLLPGAANLYDVKQGSYISPNEDRWSLFDKNTWQLADDFELFAQNLLTRRKVQDLYGSSGALLLRVPPTNPFYVNPTGVPGPVMVVTGTTAYFGPQLVDNRIDTGNFSFGAAKALGGGWSTSGSIAYTFEKQRRSIGGAYDQAALNAALADPNPATALNPFGDGANTNPATLASIRGVNELNTSSSLRTVGATARGPVLTLSGGDVETTVGAEYRVQSLQTITAVPGAGLDTDGRLSRHVAAAFGELRIPVVTDSNEFAWTKRLEMSVGVRRESYSDVGGITIPKFGLLWSPLASLGFRGTWTKSFKPPNLADLIPAKEFVEVVPLPDPASPTGSTVAMLRSGTNPGLRPETARTWTFGTDFTPKFLPGASLSLTYFDITYAGRINQELTQPDVLSHPELAWLVNRNVTQAQVSSICSQSVFQQSSLSGGSAACTDPSIGVIVDERLQNIAMLKTSGIDLLAKYSFDSRSGKFDFGLNGTYLFNYSQANTPGDPLVDIVSTETHPINLRFRGSAAWTRRGMGVAAFVNFENSYRDTLSVPNRGISPWTTVDLQLSYETAGDTLGWLDRVQFALNAQNLFDVYPPFLNNSQGYVGYDQENANLYGRLVSFEIRKRW